MRRNIVFPLLAGLIAFLTIAGGGTAYAIWSASAHASLMASSATIGVTATDTTAGTGLAVGYNQANDVYGNAGTVTIANTGSREAWYGLTVTVQSESVTELQSVIRVGASVVASPSACTASAMPSDTLSSGTWTWHSTSATPAQLAAAGQPGDSAILCIVTWLPEDEISDYGSTSIDLAIQTSLSYTNPVTDPNAAWVAIGDFDAATPGLQPLVVHQTVTTADLALLFDNPVGRYWVWNAYADSNGTLNNLGEVCKGGGLDMPVRFDGVTSCSGDAWNSQWRLVPVTGLSGVWWILQATNSYTQPATPRWSYTSSTAAITDQSPSNSDPTQMWVIEGRGDGTYRIKSYATAGSAAPVCIAVSSAGRAVSSDPGATSYGSLPGSTSVLVPATCSGTAPSQGFRFDLIGNPVPSTVLDSNGNKVYPNGYPLTCDAGGSIYNRTFSWPTSTGYEGEVQYRVYFDDVKVLDYTNGYHTTASLGSYSDANTITAAIQSWWTAHGSGAETSAQVVVQQQITELGTWAPITAPLTVWVDHLGTNSNPIYCTQQVTTPTAPPSGGTSSLTGLWTQTNIYSNTVQGNLAFTNNTGSTVKSVSIVIRVPGATSSSGNSTCTYNGDSTFTCVTPSWSSTADGATSGGYYQSFTGSGVPGTGTAPYTIISITKVS